MSKETTTTVLQLKAELNASVQEAAKRWNRFMSSTGDELQSAALKTAYRQVLGESIGLHRAYAILLGVEFEERDRSTVIQDVQNAARNLR